MALGFDIDHANAAKALEAMTLEMRLACTPALEAAARDEPVFKAPSTPADWVRRVW